MSLKLRQLTSKDLPSYSYGNGLDSMNDFIKKAEFFESQIGEDFDDFLELLGVGYFTEHTTSDNLTIYDSGSFYNSWGIDKKINTDLFSILLQNTSNLTNNYSLMTDLLTQFFLKFFISPIFVQKTFVDKYNGESVNAWLPKTTTYITGDESYFYSVNSLYSPSITIPPTTIRKTYFIGDLGIDVESNSFPDSGYIQIEQEILSYSSKDNTSGSERLLGIKRELFGTRRKDHTTGNYVLLLDRNTNGRPVSNVDNPPVRITGDITNDTTSFLAFTDGYPPNGYLIIDNEIVSYTGITPTTFTNIKRGLFNTKQVDHSSGVYVFLLGVGSVTGYYSNKKASDFYNPLPSLPNRNNYTPLTGSMYSIGLASFGLLDNFLKVTLKVLNISRDQIVTSPELIKWFGCYAPLPTFPGSDSLKSVCDPLCVNQDAIKLYDVPEIGDITVNQQECNGTLCILSDATISSYGSAGNIRIEQICPGCYNGNGECRCVVDVTIPGVLNKLTTESDEGMSNAATFYQYCPNATCIQFDPITGITDLVPCDQGISRNALSDVKNDFFPPQVSDSTWIWMCIIFLVFLIFILAAYYIATHRTARVPLL